LSLVFAKPDEPADAHESTHAHASTQLAGSVGSDARINLAVKAAAKAPAHVLAAELALEHALPPAGRWLID